MILRCYCKRDLKDVDKMRKGKRHFLVGRSKPQLEKRSRLSYSAASIISLGVFQNMLAVDVSCPVSSHSSLWCYVDQSGCLRKPPLYSRLKLPQSKDNEHSFLDFQGICDFQKSQAHHCLVALCTRVSFVVSGSLVLDWLRREALPVKVIRRISWDPVPLAARQLFPQALCGHILLMDRMCWCEACYWLVSWLSCCWRAMAATCLLGVGRNNWKIIDSFIGGPLRSCSCGPYEDRWKDLGP